MQASPVGQRISRVTDAVLAEVSDWQIRALEPMYPIVFLDALRIKIRDAESRQVKNKAVYEALGVTPEGEREVLGLWIAANAPLGHCANALPELVEDEQWVITHAAEMTVPGRAFLRSVGRAIPASTRGSFRANSGTRCMPS